MNVLVTGALGFTGQRIVGRLRQREGIRLFQTDMRPDPTKDIAVCDLTSPKEVLNLIEAVAPDQVYHLAGGFTNVYESDYRANVLTTKIILDSILDAHISARVLLVGSASEYGLIEAKDNPLKEDAALHPVSIYGMTKVFQTYLMKYYCVVKQMDIVMARTFNLMGKGMSENLFVGKAYRQIEEYKKGRISKVLLGNLESRRDYVSVDKAVECYEILMNYGKVNEVYNVGSGRPTRMRDILAILLMESGLSESIVEQKVSMDRDKLDIPEIYADIGKLKQLCKSHQLTEPEL